MKNILLILFMIMVGLSYGQTYPTNQSIGNTPTTLVTTNSLRANQAVILGSFVDTTAANLLPYLKNYSGAMIYTTSDGSIWVRNPDKTAWVQIGGGVTPSGSFWRVGGNLFPVTAPTRNIGTLEPYGGAIGFMTNSKVHLILSDTGLFRNQSVDDSVLVKNTLGEFGVYPKSAFSGSTYTFPYSVVAPGDAIQLENDTSTTVANYFYGTNSAGRRTWLPQSGIVGVTPTWQQTLTAGSALTGNNTITGANNTFTFNYGANTSFLALYGATTGGYTINTTSSFESSKNVTAQAVHSSGNPSYHRIINTRTGAQTEQYIYSDSIFLLPHLGQINIDTLQAGASSDNLIGWASGTNRGKVGYVTIGSGLSLSSGVLSSTGGGITVGTTTITSGTNTRILYNNSGVVGEYTVTGTGTEAVLSTSPTFVTSLTSPIIYGSAAANGDLNLNGTSNGTTATSSINMQASGGNVGIGTSTPTAATRAEILGDANFPTMLKLSHAGTPTAFLELSSVYGTVNTWGSIFKGSELLISQSDGTFRIAQGANHLATFTALDGLVAPRRFQEHQGADVASANNITLGSDGNIFEITGTTQINLIANTNWQNGAEVTLLLPSGITVAHGQTTSGSNITIILAGAANFTTTSASLLKLVYSEVGGTNAWREVSRTSY